MKGTQKVEMKRRTIGAFSVSRTGHGRMNGSISALNRVSKESGIKAIGIAQGFRKS